MRKPAKQYHVEKYHDVLDWRPVFGTETQSKQWCLGWIACMDSLYPSAPYRVMCRQGIKCEEIAATKGRGEVHTN